METLLFSLNSTVFIDLIVFQVMNKLTFMWKSVPADFQTYQLSTYTQKLKAIVLLSSGQRTVV